MKMMKPSVFLLNCARGGLINEDDLAQALKERNSSFQAKPLPCSGFEACKLAFLKAAKGIGDFNFIEGMACEGGCVQGAGIVIRSPKNQAEVGKHVKAAGERTIHAAVEAAP